MKCAILNFPGSNGIHDAYYALKDILGYSTKIIQVNEKKDSYNLIHFDFLIIPGGFSYGDYLRPGFFASLYLDKNEIHHFLKNGGFILGICNGFQILTEMKLLEGTLISNVSSKFISQFVYLKFNENSYTNSYQKAIHNILKLPIAHSNGNYFCSQKVYSELKKNNQIVLEYSSIEGHVTPEFNPNGSIHNIAGIFNKDKNILGVMPHPERAMEEIIGSKDGQIIFEWIEKRFHKIKKN